MKFPESWLRSFVDPSLDTDALAHQLTMSGLEVEEVEPVAPPFSGVVVGQILDAAQHPDADRLRVCRVDVGAAEPLQIVCGAPNARAGIKIPCAQVGAQLPPAEAGGKPFAIKVGKLRGVESYGMLCSAGELKLPQDSDGLLELPMDAPVGANIRDYLQLDDQIFEIKLTPNKADCLSVLGVAREVAALTGAPLQTPAARTVAATLADTVPVKISAPDLCGRFAGRVIRGVNARAQTPPAIKARLERAGLRSVSVLVDLSNYLMLEAGQPTHVFDLDKLDGGLEVRWAKAGETLKLLNGNTVTLDDTVGVVATSAGVVESLAGVMGGDATAVTLDTTNIYVEAAFWWPAAIQGRARKFNFSTDAAHRFERGVDFAQTAQQLDALTALILDVCGGQAGPLDDQIVNLPQRSPVSLRLARAQKILGIPVSRDEVAAIFTRLGLVFDVREQGETVFVVMPPPFRFDLEIEEDLIEEVARVYGFDNIPARPPVAANVMQPTDETRRPLHALRHLLAARDYHEVVNYAFVDAQWETDLAGNQHPIALRNPIASQMSVMRSTLFGGLLANVRYNLNRKASRVRAFELGRVFARDNGVADGGLTVAGFAQPMLIGGVAWGSALPEQWGAPSRRVDFYDVKGDVEALLAPRTARFVAAAHPALHPGRSAAIEVDGRRIGWIGELHPRWQQQYELPQPAVLFELDAHAITAVGLPQPAPVSRFQPVTRDLALVVAQKVEVQQLFDAFAAQKVAIVQQVALFDEFRPQGDSAALAADEKSLAFRVTLQGADATLQDADVDAAIAQLVAAAQTVGARLRA